VNRGIRIVNVVSKVVSGGRVEGRDVSRQESVVSSMNRSLVERRPTTRDKGLPCKSLFLFYV
jgi:hypothetical protein